MTASEVGRALAAAVCPRCGAKASETQAIVVEVAPAAVGEVVS